MTTKAEERKALEQIRKIIAGLGEDSYVGTAFEGCFEIAESNIENDWACSMKQKYEWAEQVRQQDALELINTREERDAAVKRAEEAERIANAKIESADKWIAKYKEADDLCVTNWNKFREQEDRADALEQEVIKLKARLYDFMVKELA